MADGRSIETAGKPAWDSARLADPHAAADKAGRVRRMFAAIAPSYDVNNRLHSLWRDQAWRRAAVRLAEVGPGDVVLDVACGTGDLALALADRGPARVIGVDFVEPMLAMARCKSTASRRPSPIAYTVGDAMALPLADRSVDVVSIAFGLRNVTAPQKAIESFYRVLRPGGRLVVLEFSLPANPLLRSAYNLYFRHVLPRTATLIAGDRTGAYRYLPESVNTFIDRAGIVGLMHDAGFTGVQARAMTLGIAVAYLGYRR
jgi:demethylmenaquinone methyltransferase/2-methoxy-6-polyprenyl-1,4-benzoquinol methylase